MNTPCSFFLETRTQTAPVLMIPWWNHLPSLSVWSVRSISRTDGSDENINSPATEAVDNNPPILGNGHCLLLTNCAHASWWWVGTCVTTQTSVYISSLQRALLSFHHSGFRSFHCTARLPTASIAFNDRLQHWPDNGSWELPAQTNQTYHKWGFTDTCLTWNLFI